MGKFVIRSKGGSFSFILKAANGEPILVSETYTSESACKNGIASVQKNAAAPIEDQTAEGAAKVKNPKYEVYADKAGQYRFRLKAGNGEIIGQSEAYKAKASCIGGVESVQKNAPKADIVAE